MIYQGEQPTMSPAYPCRETTKGRQVQNRRRAAVLVATCAAAGLAMTGCSVAEGILSGSDSGQEASSGDSAEQAPAFQAESGIAGTTTLPIDASFTPVEESLQTSLLAPGVDLRITEVAQVQTLSADVYTDLTGQEPLIEAESPDGQDQSADAVAPADGETFLVASYASDDPQWEPRDNTPDSEASILLNGNEVADAFSTDEGTRHRGTIVVSAPADSSPQDVVLEVETDEVYQSLSLIDGTRVASDVEHIYGVAGSTVEIVSADEFEETFSGWTDEEQRIAGSVTSAFVTPWLDSSHGGQGWAGPGKIYLSVAVDWAEFEATSEDLSTIFVELPDGSTVRQHDPGVTLGSPFSDDPAFAIPAQTETLTVVIEPKVNVGAGASEKEHSWDPVKATLEIHSA